MKEQSKRIITNSAIMAIPISLFLKALEYVFEKDPFFAFWDSQMFYLLVMSFFFSIGCFIVVEVE